MNHGQRQTQIPRPSSSNGLANRTGVALCRTLANAFWNPAARSGRLDLLRPWLHGQCSNPNYGIVNGHQAIVCEGGRPLFIYLALAFALQLSHLGAEHLLHRTVACTSLGFTHPQLQKTRSPHSISIDMIYLVIPPLIPGRCVGWEPSLSWAIEPSPTGSPGTFKPIRAIDLDPFHRRKVNGPRLWALLLQQLEALLGQG